MTDDQARFGDLSDPEPNKPMYLPAGGDTVQARWTVEDGDIVCMFPTGDAVDISELYHPATPPALAIPAKTALAALVRDHAALTRERDALRAFVNAYDAWAEGREVYANRAARDQLRVALEEIL